ncbi:MAG: hypothetical protein RMK65_06855 [Anaerolineae bacterium]|nr:hypothetical protein [Anaerolineae bacterium]MDW7991842.1 hypothetical protein [Anaerolineae bacterium]
MSRRGKLVRPGLLLVLLCLTGGIVLAQSTPAIVRWHIGGGGGTAIGGTASISGALGQAVAGLSSGGNITLQAGFWTGRRQAKIYLPLVLRDYISYFEGPCEQEDNDRSSQANGPLYSGRYYCGYPNDWYDWFYVYLRTTGRITVSVTNYTGAGGQLLLFSQLGELLKRDYQGANDYDLYLEHTVSTGGIYYITVYTERNFNTTPYTLRVTYP